MESQIWQSSAASGSRAGLGGGIMVLAAGAGLVLDQHGLSAITLTGMALDVLGALYLAYDLLGGVHGPLRLLSSIVTYILVFMVAMGSLLDWALDSWSEQGLGLRQGWSIVTSSRSRGK